MEIRKSVPRSTQLIKNVVIALLGGLEHHTGLLKQVSPHASTLNVELFVEVDLNELAKA